MTSGVRLSNVDILLLKTIAGFESGNWKEKNGVLSRSLFSEVLKGQQPCCWFSAQVGTWHSVVLSETIF